jgi:hypothetical protein
MLMLTSAVKKLKRLLNRILVPKIRESKVLPEVALTVATVSVAAAGRPSSASPFALPLELSLAISTRACVRR